MNIMLVTARWFFIFLYFIIVKLFLVLINNLEYIDFLFCYDCTEDIEKENTTFDYIIVGCGSAGALIARRLSDEKNVTVLVLEAGNYGNKLLDIPTLGVLLQKTQFDWQYTTISQTNSCLALNNNASTWPMGKIVGGTGMLNNMIYVRGHSEDFNDWFKNKEGYSFENDILPYFTKLERGNSEVNEDAIYGGRKKTQSSNIKDKQGSPRQSVVRLSFDIGRRKIFVLGLSLQLSLQDI
nr:glucose dehydrogenase [FAD, quinone]-like isoform X4 [Leptinotarsa decemlineata]